MSQQTFTTIKDPNEVLDYKFDWATNVLAVGETISTSTVTASAGITKASDSITDTNTTVTVWLSGGTAGQSYTVASRITTSSARTYERTMTVRVQER
jgi:hypothetical protein